ncbi:hypothetical protein [Pseudorhizobium pelagicum]|uniref:Uncharacterized protein n=1 Tax=Pseudorhizobium pelagicum TaxID=1509405 RepID=A0A922T764_9HYPH|nr:hypothetical protein [Pseudorhizobium pelagicum]KEQ04762.1 hypothetical protein GV68_12290 [Pseudorhizobium pelagicum]KEQ07363.1 hypothetical protein GV67_21515 [Pseudorhizobium pelagicum]
MSRHLVSVSQDPGIGLEGDFDDQPEERIAGNGRQSLLAQRQRAEVSLMVNKRAGFKAKAEISNGGLLSIAALVSSILLTTTVLVHVAVSDGKRRRFL